MFNQSVEKRLSAWIDLRQRLNTSNDPLQDVWDFWHQAPFIPHNKKVNLYYQDDWPTPWEIIADNKYDDFTRALMISWTLKLTEKYSNSKIEIRTVVDTASLREYNLVYIDDSWVINYSDNGPVLPSQLVNSFKLENHIEVSIPR